MTPDSWDMEVHCPRIFFCTQYITIMVLLGSQKMGCGEQGSKATSTLLWFHISCVTLRKLLRFSEPSPAFLILQMGTILPKFSGLL